VLTKKDTFGTIKPVFCAFTPDTLILELSHVWTVQKAKFITLTPNNAPLVLTKIPSSMANIAHRVQLILNGTMSLSTAKRANQDHHTTLLAKNVSAIPIRLLKQTANAFPVPCLISLTKKTKAVTSAHSINSSTLNLRNASAQNLCPLKHQRPASHVTSLTTLTTQPKNANHVPKIMCITLMKISAGDAHKVHQFSLTKNAHSAQKTILTSTFRLKTVQNVPSSKFTIRSQNNANALLKKKYFTGK
jgi:hypothetical protein